MSSRYEEQRVKEEYIKEADIFRRKASEEDEIPVEPQEDSWECFQMAARRSEREFLRALTWEKRFRKCTAGIIILPVLLAGLLFTDKKSV